MMKTFNLGHKTLLVVLVFNMLLSCKKEDELKPNTDPDTKLFLSSINRTGTDRLNAVVEMNWSADDKDGYILGYEISFDNINWVYTSEQDSTFRFSLNAGTDTADINFYVRAIDNDGNKDKTPAFLKIPIKNTLPTIALDRNYIKGDSVFSVFSILWTANDLDGAATLDSVYIKINNGNWFAISKNFNFASFVTDNPEVNGSSTASVYVGNSTINLNKKINGLVVGAANTIYIKVKDLSGAESLVDSLNPFILRRKTSDLLVLDAFNIATTPNADVVYRAAISSAYGAFDYYDFYRQSNAYFPKLWRPTFLLMMNLYDKIFIYSDNARSVAPGFMLLEDGSGAFQDYLNQGGKLLIATDIDNNANTGAFSKSSTLFQYTPADSFQTFFAANQKASMPVDSLLVPDAINAAGYPVLKVSNFADAVDPFYAKSSALPVYKAQIRRTNGVTNTRTMCAKTLNVSSQTNQIFFSMDLYKLQADADGNGQQDELKKFFEKVLKGEFNW
jgi:hypothetical protein